MGHCNCGKTTCTTVTKDCILRYTGETIDCIGVAKNELMETVIQTLAESICALNEQASCCQETVLYSENTLGSGTPGISPLLNILAGTTYTVPVGGTGLYRLTHSSDIEMGENAIVILFIFINGVGYNVPTTVKQVRGFKNSTIPCILFASNIPLVEGDIITIHATTTHASSFPINATYELIKIT